jgi:hypothetical protein
VTESKSRPKPNPPLDSRRHRKSAVARVVNGWYQTSRSAAQAARRGALLIGGLGELLSASELQSLRERFTVSADAAKSFEKADYYATTLPPSAGRLAEMLEESALYNEHLQRISANVMLCVLLFFTACFLAIALAMTPFVERDTTFIIIRVFLAVFVFVMSSDVIGAYRAHRSAAQDIKDVRQRLSTADKNGYPLPDVLLAMTDYNVAVEGAPESVPGAYYFNAKALDDRWKQYQDDRAAARAATKK